MDFTHFEMKQFLPALHWLGRQDWIVFQDLPEKRAVAMRPRPLFVNPTPEEMARINPATNPIVVNRREYERFPKTMWQELKKLHRILEFDVIGNMWYNALAKSLAGGPKLFQPTTEQCLALENTSATFPFEMYRQPYPVVILEIPEGYRQHIRQKYNTTDAPTHVFVHHEEKHNYIAVAAFVNTTKIITHLTPRRAEYQTIEDSITKNRTRRSDHILAGTVVDALQEAEFDAAENVQRLGMNFAMMMTLLGVNNAGPSNPQEYRRWKEEARATRRGGVPTHRAVTAQESLDAAMFILKFDQHIDFYDEVTENVEVGSAAEIEHLRRSPRTHWRRGHWTQQPCGPGSRDRKPIFRKPKLVRANYFLGDLKNTSTTYTAHPGR